MTEPINVESLFSVKGMVALVTGGGTGTSPHHLLLTPPLTPPPPGIGLMIAKALADAGAARVYIVGRRTDVLQSGAAAIGKPSVVVPLYCDVTSKISLESVVSIVENDAGYLNLVVCNAGIGGPQVPFPAPGSSIEEFREKNLAHDFDEYTNTFRVNASSVWFTAMACLKLLDEGNKKGNLAQSSQVVVTSSIAAFNKKAPGGWAYGQSKAATTHLAKQLSVLLPTWGIRANCICPGRELILSSDTPQGQRRLTLSQSFQAKCRLQSSKQQVDPSVAMEDSFRSIRALSPLVAWETPRTWLAKFCTWRQRLDRTATATSSSWMAGG